MTDPLVARFIEDGFVKVEGAFSGALASACADLLWHEIGYAADDPGSWVEPVRWIPYLAQEQFRRTANTPVLRDAYDRLAGRGRWLPRTVLGAFPLRFPHADEPDDAGWHVDASYVGEDGLLYTDLLSRGRVLLMLFLFTEIDEDTAPTRIRVGSHLDVAPVLEPFGTTGATGPEPAARIDAVSAHRPVVTATGHPGDVYLCHPHLVHAAAPHHGRAPRFMAQPPLTPAQPLRLERADGDYSPVEHCLRRALGR